MTDMPVVNLKVETVTCATHGELFRSTWPAGWLAFAVSLAGAAFEDEELAAAAGKDAQHLDAAVAEFGPLCRLATPEQRLAAYRAADEASEEFGATGFCAACRKPDRRGMPYTARSPDAPGDMRAIVTRHVCFECLANQNCED